MKNISVNADEDLISDFDSLCKKLGLNRTSAINVFMTQAVREQRIPFEITAAHDTVRQIFDDQLLSGIEEGIADWRAGKTLSREEARSALLQRRGGKIA